MSDPTLDHLNVQIVRLLEERARIVAILRAFHQAPITIAGLQPVLELAVTLNPDLAFTRRAVGSTFIDGPSAAQ